MHFISCDTASKIHASWCAIEKVAWDSLILALSSCFQNSQLTILFAQQEPGPCIVVWLPRLEWNFPRMPTTKQSALNESKLLEFFELETTSVWYATLLLGPRKIFCRDIRSDALPRLELLREARNYPSVKHSTPTGSRCFISRNYLLVKHLTLTGSRLREAWAEGRFAFRSENKSKFSQYM